MTITAAAQFQIKLFNFYHSSTQLSDFIYANAVTYRDALDRLRVRLNIILLRRQTV